EAVHTACITDVELEEPAARVAQRGGEIGFLLPAIVEGVEVVEDDDLRAVGQEAIDQVRTDEARSAGHQGSHRTFPLRLSHRLRKPPVGLAPCSPRLLAEIAIIPR